MVMNIFVAGGSGTIGVPLVRALVAAGHGVMAMTRSKDKEGPLRALGATVTVVDALDRDALARAVADAHPTHVIHQLTALPKAGASRPSDLEATNRLRIEGTRNLLEAAIHARAQRILVGSFAMLSARDGGDTSGDPAADAVRSMDTQVLDANARGAIEGIVLRYGLFYGLSVPSMLSLVHMTRRRHLPVILGDDGQLPVINLDDAVSATVLALDRAMPGAVYDIVDDRPVSFSEMVETIAEYTGSPTPRRVPAWIPRLVAPYMSRLMTMQVPLSNAKAKSELGWQPTYPTIREGLAPLAHLAA
jgi:nucleoside-diphosphate-sugar epimerase